MTAVREALKEIPLIFAAKAPQAITHEKVLVDAEGDLKAFLKVMDLLGDKVGLLLFQFPYFNKQKFRLIWCRLR